MQAYRETRLRRKLEGLDVSTLSSSSSENEIKDKKSSQDFDDDDFNFGKNENFAEKTVEEE